MVSTYWLQTNVPIILNLSWYFIGRFLELVCPNHSWMPLDLIHEKLILNWQQLNSLRSSNIMVSNIKFSSGSGNGLSPVWHINGLVQDCGTSTANALKSRVLCKPFVHKQFHVFLTNNSNPFLSVSLISQWCSLFSQGMKVTAKFPIQITTATEAGIH